MVVVEILLSQFIVTSTTNDCRFDFLTNHKLLLQGTVRFLRNLMQPIWNVLVLFVSCSNNIRLLNVISSPVGIV